MKLAAKLILVSIIAVIAVLIASNYVTAHLALTQIKKEHQEYAMQMSAEMERPIADAWKNGGASAILEYVQSQEPRANARWVWFEKGTTTASTRPYASADFSNLVTRQTVVSYIAKTNERSRNLYTYCPVKLNENKTGGLEFSMDLDQHDEGTAKHFVESLIAVSAMALISILVVLFAGVRMIGRPLENLTDVTKQIGEGDFSQRVPVTGNDELGQLARSINEMSERLETQNREIKNETSQKINALRQLRHADRLKTIGRMAAGIAHEIGTPLSVVSGRAALIADGDLTHEKIKKNALTIQNETDKISSMIRQLLDFARQAPMQKSEVDLNELLTQSTDLLKPMAEKQKIDIKISLSAEPATAKVNPALIQQVLTNIIVNAIQSMPAGGSLELKTALHHTAYNSSTFENFWVISIADQGCGIASNELETIFEPFFTTKDVGKGTGLGLSIAYSIVQEHEGWIDVESDVGKGSRFQIYLPAAGD